MRKQPDSTSRDRAGEGRLYILSAPSGTGKTSLIKYLLEHDDGVCVSVSHTTRPPRDGEKDGQSYHFVSSSTFTSLLETHEFLEHARIFEHHYGTSRILVEKKLAAGMDVLLEIDWQGARQVRELHDGSISIFILPPGYAALRKRLQGREGERSCTVEQRLSAASVDIAHYDEYDYIIINDDFDRAARELLSVFSTNRLHYDSNHERHDRFVRALQGQIAKNA